MDLLPRLIRMKDAPRYVGMDRHRFNEDVRPYLTEIPMGTQGIAFDRLEIDAWVEDYIKRNGRRPKLNKSEDDVYKNIIKCQGSERKAIYVTLKNDVSSPKAVGSVSAQEHLAG